MKVSINENPIQCILDWMVLIHQLVFIHIDTGPSRRINQSDASDANIPRRAQIARNQNRRNAPQPQPSASNQESDESEGESNRPNPFAEAKIGTKKRAKLEAKAERQRLREAELVVREVQTYI